MSRTLRQAALAAALLLPAFAAGAQNLRLAINEDPDAMDPTVARTFTGRIVFAALCDKLVDIDAKLNIVPQLATEFAWENPTTLAFKLRPNVVFHDGTKVDAEAVKYSLMRHLTMAGSTRRGEIAAMDSVEVIDPLAVKIHLKTPNAPFLAQLTDRAGMIVSPKAAEAAGKDFSLNPVCAGPFKFTERVPQDRIVLDRFDGYWNKDAIKLARITYRPIPDNTVKMANLQAGALDMAERFLPSDVENLKKDPKIKLVFSDNLGYQSLTFNVTNGTRPRTPMMTDARVRQAFALAIDRQALIDVVYNGLYTPIAQSIPPANPFYAADVKPAARDVAKARALLAAAGVKTPLAVELLTSNSPDQRQTGEVIQSMAAEAGFDVKLRTTEFVTALKASDDGDYEVFLIGWSGRADPDGNLYSFVKTKAPLNASLYSDAEVDSLLDQSRAITAIPERKALFAKLATKLNQDLPLMYLYTPKAITGMSTKVSGYTPVPDNLIRPQGITLAP